MKKKKHFSFLAYQRCVQLLYETLDTLIEALTAFTANLSFVDRQTDKSKDQASKEHHYFSRIDPGYTNTDLNISLEKSIEVHFNRSNAEQVSL